MRTNLFLTSMMASGLVFAQSDVIQYRTQADSPAPRTIYFNQTAEAGLGAAEFVRGEFGSFATVKGAPYTAEATTESVQVLQDGNRIIHRDTTTQARDSQGRTRRDMSPVLPGLSAVDAPRFSFLFDPTNNTSYTLNHSRRTASKSSGRGFNIQFSTAAVPTAGVARPARVGVIGGIVGSRETAVVQKFEHTEILNGPVEDAVAGFKVLRDSETAGSNSRVEQLGKQTMEGVLVEGTRNVTTIPAGQIGNERDIEIVNERWYSPELQMVVMSKHNDPRQGQTTYMLKNIRREEPNKSLFEVPPGYTLEEPVEPKIRMRQPLPKE